MQQDMTEIERLDWAARAEVSESVLFIYQLAAGALCAVLSVLGFAVLSHSAVALTLELLAGFAATTTATLLFRWRYSLHALAVFFFVTSLVLLMQPSRTPGPLRPLVWLGDHGYALCLIPMAFGAWKEATPFAMVIGNAWFEETAQVQNWLQTLQDRFTTQQVLELKTSDLWRGCRVYRLLYLGTCWAVATFGDEQLGRPSSYRIRDLSAVRLIRLEDRTLDVEIDGRLIRGAQLSPAMRDRIADLLAAGV